MTFCVRVGIVHLTDEHLNIVPLHRITRAASHLVDFDLAKVVVSEVLHYLRGVDLRSALTTALLNFHINKNNGGVVPRLGISC